MTNIGNDLALGQLRNAHSIKEHVLIEEIW